MDTPVHDLPKFPLVYSEACLRYDFGGGHPLNSRRLQLTVDLLRALGLLEGGEVGVVAPRQATEEEIQTVHDPDYVAAVRALSADPGQPVLGRMFGFGPGDNPPFAGMHEAAATIVGGALVAAEGIFAGRFEHAFHPSGGLHHAMRAGASGFCIYNDVAIACEFFRRRLWRVLYVDGDAHHGDGVQAIFYDSPEVLTVSLHESGEYLFPGTGFVRETGRGAGVGYAVNVPLLPGTDDLSWIECFELVVPEVARAFRPDVIVSQHGCDTHRLDPLTDLCCTTHTAEHFARRMHELAHELCGGRWLATGGGGYDIWRVVPRAWTLVYAALSHRLVPEEIPPSWITRWQPESPVELPRRMRDEPFQDAPASLRRKNREAAQRARDQALAALEG
ncbi:MAG: acetoin utilization protein AcuC [Armatimonadota bacterium]|nr:acetoin utilization protein AcuC [Armatimonadota bacterium]MDR7438502.1 acetoin utilization protein AcuC [Armatimonadota bacterium]MDR7562310.1 acetoin utilization protein AcuC [Armatimonadota bacterium]MDR7567425.1 acetoin utilization protein AcuC [Armatimonadota bacterium]MDR7602559.1 acetoin utilization protein AcuC [Armatimonadota bacterium]